MNSAISSRNPRYSVIIVTYNSRENIGICLDSLRRCGGITSKAGADGSTEIIVVDNNSRDGTQDYLSAQGDIRAVLNTENNGFSKGCNQGAAIAKGEYVVFLNPDTLATPGWSDSMARYFQDPSVGAVGPVSNYVAGLQRLDMNLPAAWRDGKTIPGKGAMEQAENLAIILKDANAGKGVTTKLLIGFCLMMQRALYESMGGMDENLFLGNDDLDLSWRLRNAGRKLVVASDAFVFHEGQKSFKTESKSIVDRLTQESTDALYLKLVGHYGGREKVPSAIELWGIGWFSPSPSLLEGPLPLKGGNVDSGRGLRIKTETQVPANPEAASPQAGAASQNAWKAITAIVYLGADADISGGDAACDAASRLERTLATLPARPGTEIIVLNCAGNAGAPEAPAGANLRKLDLGSGFPMKQALDIALAMMPGTHGLFCLAGVEFSAMFNHWLDKRDLSSLPASLPLPLRIGDEARTAAPAGAGASASCPAFAFLGRKEWIRDMSASLPAASGSAEILAAMGDRLLTASRAAAGKPSDPPWLMARNADLPAAKPAGMEPAAKANDSWTPVKNEPAAAPAPAAKSQVNLLNALNQMGRNAKAQTVPEAAESFAASISAPALPMAPVQAGTEPPAAPKPGDSISLYPECLRPAMREAKNIGFAGTNAQTPPVSGRFQVFNLKGDLVPIAAQDLLILRVTPDLIDGLTERLANIRRLAPCLKRLITVINGAQAKGIASTSPVAPVDLTPAGIRSALWGAGFAVTDVRPYSGFVDGVLQKDVLQGWAQVEAIPRTTAHQTEKMVSIVILGFNQVAYTRKCIESIRKYTRQKYELILVDNGSKDGTEEFFRSIPGAKVIINKENLGVAKGWNQGMRLAVGEYLLILNNDIIVGPDWLENMVRLAESDPSIGLVGPRSNYIAGPQVVPNVPYKAEGEIQDFIRKWQDDHQLGAAEFGFIKGFCHLIPRRVFEKVGFYDERFGKGNFEDDDYCLRVNFNGFRALFADDSFIHHYGSVSFQQDSVDWKALMIENRQKYERKWAKGASAVNDTYLDPVSVPAQAGAPVLTKVDAGRLAYEKGEMQRARNLFLEAQASNPSDPEPYCCLGALMFSEGLLDDAMSLLMQCLNLEPSHADAAQNLLDTLAAGGGSVSFQETDALTTRYPSNRVFQAAHAEKQGAAKIDSMRAAMDALAAGMPAAPATEPSSPIDESRTWTPVSPSREHTAMPRQASSAPAPLSAWRKEVETLIGSAKYAPAMDILEVRLKSHEEPAACQNYLGIIAHALGDADMALTHFGNALKLNPGDADTVFNMSDTLLAIGRPAEAAELLEDCAHKTGVESDPNIPDLAATAEQIRYAMAKGKVDADLLLASRDANQQAERMLRSGETDEAMAYLDAALEADPKDFRALNNLGLLAWYQGGGQTAWNCFVACLDVRPTWADALINAFDTALAYREIEAIDPLLDAALAIVPGHPQVLAMRRHVQAQGAAIYGFKSYENLEANAARLRKAETAMERAKQGDAILHFLEAVDLEPLNPQAYNGLGIIAFSEGRHADAFALFETASSQHPMDQDILMNFWQCAQALRREGDVLPRLRSCLERNPALEDVKAIVKEFA